MPLPDEHISGMSAVVTAVAREGKYLTTNTGFSEESTRIFTRDCRRQGFPQFVAVDADDDRAGGGVSGPRVVGWCDVVARTGQPRSVGFLGVGLLPRYRGQGLGLRLMSATIRAAARSGFDIIRLECRASNKRAINLYKKMGFRFCGYDPFGLVLDGEVFPTVRMKSRIIRLKLADEQEDLE